jgi:hypothetical protein
MGGASKSRADVAGTRALSEIQSVSSEMNI